MFICLIHNNIVAATNIAEVLQPTASFTLWAELISSISLIFAVKAGFLLKGKHTVSLKTTTLIVQNEN